MGLISLLMQNPAAFVMLVVPLLYSIIFHELAHGLTALWFGDRTAKDAGRLSLNPVQHLDLVGTLMLFFVGFGWAKPVPVGYYKLKNSKTAFIAVSLAGCLTNILIAMIAVLFMQLLPWGTVFYSALAIVARINIVLGSFNLIPIPPLDGSRVLMALLPINAQIKLARLEPYGFFIIIFLLFSGLLYPVINFMQGLIYGLIALLLSFGGR